MAKTYISAADPKAVRRYSRGLTVDVVKNSYWTRKFASATASVSAPMRILTELESGPGDKVEYELSMQIRTKPVVGDQNKMAGKEAKLIQYEDELKIDEAWVGVNAGGRVTRTKRSNHNYRQISKDRQQDWWARYFDELCFAYAAGATGIDTGSIVDENEPMFSVNALAAPDASHIMYAGAATSKATLQATEKMSLGIIERAEVKASTMGGDDTDNASLNPVKINGEEHYVMVMHDFQMHDLRQATGSADWLEVQKAAAGAEGKKSPIFTGAEGMHKGVIIHKHRNVIRENMGAAGAVPGADALFMGDQALQCAYGMEGKDARYQWHEETDDRGRELIINSYSCFGIKKTRYNGRDKGVISVVTAAADPNA